jgi:membrane fusion protein (multidrug efflux system)
MKLKPRWWTGLVLLPAAGLALSLAAALAPATAQAQVGQAAQDAARVPVRIHRVIAEASQSALAGLGSVRCRRTLELSFEQPGLIAEMAVEEGQQVKRGQTLARLDDRVLKAEVSARQAEVAAQENEVARLSEKKSEREKLFQSRAVTQSDLREAGFELAKAQSRLEAARAELAAAQAKLQGHALKAPAEGIILKRDGEVGEVVAPGQRKVLKLGECRQVLAEVEFGEKLYTRLTPGQGVIVTADALPGREFKGVIEAVAPEVEPKNRTFLVKAAVANPDLALKPGMFVRAQVKLDMPGGGETVWVPREALAADAGQRGTVTVIEGGRASAREVVLGRRDPQRVEVVSGLKPGEQVILSGPPEAAPAGAPRP